MNKRSDGRWTKLTWEQVDEIRELAKTKTNLAEIGRQYGVSRNAIFFIVEEIHWRPENDPRRKD